MIKSVYKSSGGSIFEMPSVTRPNQALSIQEILDRYAVGRDVPYCQGSYDESDGIMDVPTSDLDIVDREERIQQEASLIFDLSRAKVNEPSATERSGDKRGETTESSDKSESKKDSPLEGARALGGDSQ